MNEKLQYATMLDIPVNTANITYKPIKKRRKAKRDKSPEAVKEELLQKVNAETETSAELSTDRSENAEITEEVREETPAEENKEEYYASASVHKKAKKPLFKFSAITVELIAVFSLIAVIFLTNAFYSGSAINVFMKKVFSPSTAETAREKTYDEFSPVMNFSGDITLSDGVISCLGSGAVYSPLDGVVSAVTQDESGAYTIEVAHSAVFSSKISGLSYAYLSEGDAVYGNIPVGYVKGGGFTMCFNSGDGLITDYTLEGSAVLWAV